MSFPVAASLAFLDVAKSELGAESYKQFLDLLSQYRVERVSATDPDPPTVRLLSGVSDLLNGHPALLTGMNQFVPGGFSIACSVDGKAVTVNTPMGSSTQTYP
ncbi:hypothetical protein FB45DRAFT_910488 [Roridomyces roridus]|uniref:Uncharacterized protein n=1 Tax=Roridomyces roridus TaxID=1738132 RepID=A0AAD7BZM1_9AGAR|nr:hypothetical protein FB45DRAFT_910488 [Roridomyces roridus]